MTREEIDCLYETGNLFKLLFNDYYYKSYKNQMTFLQSLVFDYLNTNENVTAKILSVEFDLPKQHISNILKKLENDGYIEKKVGEDKRYYILKVTQKGKNEYYRHLNQSDEYASELLKQITNKDDFFKQLKNVNQYLKEIKK